ncbi:MAG: histidine phosphatase family protein [Tannerellaceae bacterium]|jgi:probable phosphoglycerate mutase|nr:histidine phosphatase family protein [Tannerellaceae bacterium]
MRTKLIIARHGNTFRPGETPTRIGAETDLPLVEEEKGRNIGLYLKEHGLIPHSIYSSPLMRCIETAGLAVMAMNIERDLTLLPCFTEIDYGVDENKTEEEVMLRLGNGDLEKGKLIIDAWNKKALVPDGWNVNPQQIIRTWKDFAKKEVRPHQTALLVASNGIIRFAPCLTGNVEQFSQEHDLKVATGGICIFEKENKGPFWACTAWNLKATV